MKGTVVLGIDVGLSRTRQTTGVAAVVVEGAEVELRTVCCTAREEEVRSAVSSVAGGREIVACGIDGPLRPGLAVGGERRVCERVLVLGKMGKRCRPGEVVTPQGRRLHVAATAVGQAVAGRVGQAPGCVPREVLPLGRRAVCEAFPTAFMAVMVADERFDEARNVARGRKSDWLFEQVMSGREIGRMLGGLMEARAAQGLVKVLRRVRGHDERAAAICALTALCLWRCQFTAVGDPAGGYIILPPMKVWARWAVEAMEENVGRLVGENGAMSGEEIVVTVGDGG